MRNEKEVENVKVHRVYFQTAIHIFCDPFRMERHDADSSVDEDRWQTMGYFNDVLFVVYTERGDSTRIISARVAEPFD
ncbi:MAG: BrnT family toxin [Spirochaetota bacterium]|nr:BrnT family toxin [Spirochaetota bacterium]